MTRYGGPLTKDGKPYGGLLDKSATGVAPSITTTALPAAQYGVPYSQTVQVSGTAPFTFSVTAGALPVGLTLNASTGNISGTPTDPTADPFTIGVTSPHGSDSKAFSIVVPNGGTGGELPVVTTIILVPTEASVAVAGTVDLVVSAEDQNGEPIPNLVGQPITSDSGLATASQIAPTDANGEAVVRVTGVGDGLATVYVTIDGLSSNTSQITAGAGKVVVVGSMFATEAADTAAITGRVVNRGALLATEARDTFTGSGRSVIYGALAASEARDTLAAAMRERTVGAMAATEQPDTLAAAGRSFLAGSIYATEVTDGFAASGVVINRGAMAATEAPDQFIASVSSVTSGILSATEPQDTAEIVGNTIIRGDMAATEAPDTFDGRYFATGAMAAFEAADTFAAAAVVRILGQMDAIEAADGFTASGVLLYPGALDATEAADTFAGAGRIIVNGILSATELPDRFTATPSRYIPGVHRMAPIALRMIRKHGRPITLRVTDAGTYNPALGSVERAQIDYPAVGVRMDYEQRYIDGTTIQRGDQKLFVPPQGIPKPETGNQIVMDGRPFAIVNVGAIDPDGTPALYELQLRGVA